MAQFMEFDAAKQPRYKVELHVHLDGCIRLTTVWELAQKKGIKLPVNTLEDLCNACCIKRPCTLADFLKPFNIFLPVIVGDPEAIERIAYEFCEDAVKQGVVYTEVRYCPHLLSTTYGLTSPECENKPLMPRDVVMCVNKGLSRGGADFKLTVRSILCCFRGKPEWSRDILDLCIEFQRQGVVGIDIAGDEALGLATDIEIEVFRRAFQAGVHRTIHAGEAGPAINVERAICDMFAERIGHGYHVLDDPKVYERTQQWGVHFETCPYSSCLTGSVPLNCPKHPIVRFAEDDINFSISRDDPSLIQRTLDQEYEFLRGFGLKEVHIVRANFNAARNSFLPPEEKIALLNQLVQIYGTERVNERSTEVYPAMAPKALLGGGDF